MCHVVVGTAGLAQKCIDVLPHAECLIDNVAHMNNLTFVVDAGRAGNNDMTAVTIVNISTALKGHAIVARTVEVCRSVEVMNLFGIDAGDGIVVHLRQHAGILCSAPDACRCNEMRVVRKTLCKKDLIACTHNATVVQVDVVDKKPCADAVGGERASFLHKLHHILIEKQTCLIL